MWNQSDFEIGYFFLIDHEDLAETSLILDTEKDVMVILPLGLSGTGVTFHGLFMAAPLVLFSLILTLLPVMGFLQGWEVNFTSISLTLGCILLICGLVKAFQMMRKNRDLFPRRHFVSLGKEGIAMHFSWWQFPGRNGRTAILWSDVQSIQRSRTFFFPSLLSGIISADCIIVLGKNGDTVEIPVNVQAIRGGNPMEDIEKALAGKTFE